jgi:hypothetical protein
MADSLLAVERFLGGDPIAGSAAMHELLELGEAGEEALFSQRIEFPRTTQIRRRWIRYVASRRATVVERLLNRVRDKSTFGDAHACAYLFAALDKDRHITDTLYNHFRSRLPYRGDDSVSDCFLAWGYAGGDAAILYHLLEDDSYAWEKLATFAFRAASGSFARINAEDDWALEQLVTHQLDDGEFVKIDDSPQAKIRHHAIDGSEIWGEANGPFVVWRRGEVADIVLRDWSGHKHWRVRDFGAQILASLGFQRTVTPVLEWLRTEPLESVRNGLLHTLERSETTAGADVLLAHFESSSQEGQAFVARSAWRSSDKSRALKILKTIVEGATTAAAEAMVSMARLEHRPAQLIAALESQEPYRRLNAALAFGYLGESKEIDRLTGMLTEAATPIERVYLWAALAMLGKQESADGLHQELVAAASAKDFDKNFDVFFVHRYLQRAILDAFAARDSEGREPLSVWRAELEPLDPVAKQIEARPPRKTLTTGSSRPVRKVGFGGESKELPEPLRVFISYSHRDEKMREKLGEHLAALVDDSLIRIWHDREIEAGADWEGEINKEIAAADIILLLVSASFLNSRYCRSELQRALKQRGSGKAVPIPIILRDCDWTSVFNRAQYKIQALPRDDRPVAGGSWPNHDAAYAAIAKELRAKVEKMRGPRQDG